jgi:hypothetical protein
VRVLSNVNTYNIVTEGNCVAERRGGKQLEVNDRSAGDELDSAGHRGELARLWRSLLSLVVGGKKNNLKITRQVVNVC